MKIRAQNVFKGVTHKLIGYTFLRTGPNFIGPFWRVGSRGADNGEKRIFCF